MYICISYGRGRRDDREMRVAGSLVMGSVVNDFVFVKGEEAGKYFRTLFLLFSLV